MTKRGLFNSEFARQSHLQNVAEMEKALGTALKGLASDLRLVDAGEFTAFIRIGHMPNLKSIVQSSVELHFQAGTLELAETGEAELSWFAPPLITLPMRFCNAGVRVYFRLRLAALTAAVEIESIVVENTAGEDLAGALRDALDSARIMCVRP